jgi:prepilin-type N-terminal cleavage/methylation domain-containing protein
MKKNAGFTLVELMVVVAIIAVLIAVAIPGYIAYIPNYRLRGAAQELQGDIQMAKLQALKNGTIVSIRVNVATDFYEMFFDNGVGANTGNGTRDGDEESIKSVTMLNGIDITGTTFANNAIRFNSRGLPRAFAGGTVTMQNEKGQLRSVEIDPAGSARVE